MEGMFVTLTNGKIAQEVGALIDEKQGENTVVLDLRQHEQIAEFYIITTAANQLHLFSLLEAIESTMRQRFGIQPRRKANPFGGGWVVVDYDDIIIHLMSEQQREFYELEKIWFDVPRIYGE